MAGTVTSYDTAAGQRWRWAWTEYGEHLPSGKHQHSGKGYLLKRDAETAMRADMAKFDAGARTSSDLKMNLGDWLAKYTAARKKDPELGASTAKDDRTSINRILPLLGEKTPLRKLDMAAVDRMVGKLREPGANKRSTLSLEPLSEASISRTFVFLSGAFKEAVRLGHMTQNPCTAAKKPRPEKHIVVAWSEDELNGFLAQRQACGDRHLPLWRLAAYSGMRRSELLGLQWVSLNLKSGYLAMEASGILLDGKMIYKPGGKSESAERRLDLDPETVESLRVWKEVQALEIMASGGTPSGLVFTSEDGSGEGIKADILSNRWRTAVRESGLRRISLKDIRSTHTTILLNNGVDINTVKDRLGHASAAFTLDRYGASSPGMQAMAARTFAQAMAGGEGASVGAAEILALLGRASAEVQAEILAHLMAAVAEVADVV